MAVEALLAQLSGLRQTSGDSWIAKCPAHEDKSPSLTVRALSDGRVLIHCFAGCGAAEVVGAVGLAMTDLFPESIGHHVKRVAQPFTSMDALRALKYEGAILALSAADMAEGKPVDDARICKAVGRITEAVEYVSGK